MMISGISSASPSLNASIMYEQQIQALDSQVTRLEAQIVGLQEKIITTQENKRLSKEEKKEHIGSINEQILNIRERVLEVQAKISEVRSKQIKAEDEARKRHQAAEERDRQTRPEQEDEVIDHALVHAMSGITIKSDGLNGAKSQLNSKLSEASREDIWRIVDAPGSESHGRMVMIQNEDRRPNDSVGAKELQNRLDGIAAGFLRDNTSKSDVFKKANENASREAKLSSLNENEDHNKQRPSSGTGRWEKGQFIEDKA